MKNNFLVIAEVLRPHGVRGEIKVRSLTNFDLANFEKVYLGKENILSQILHIKNLNGFFVLQLDSLDSIEKAEKYRNQYIQIDKDDYKDLINGDLYTDDIIGFEVYDEQDKLIGCVTKADDYGATPILTISSNGMSYQIPMVNEIIWLSEDKKNMCVNRKRFDEVKI